ncbi:hypothetical protein [Rhodopseudomonas pseudopalustris]|uniref:Uncharacterized protein n=1 Tax=Rhodopseudomonas pseudopalustris TaxID=1513892 RepID=A0A1H8WIK1_9BRAD|nr:hypothetical protein [Rhodopseudomonas pseudopalustris]SEP27471.1 hypothetical protein SAMN05444123_112127 [Rhodopseudomonas pseudopalustris]
MRDVTLTKLLDKFRVEIKASPSAAHNAGARDQQVALLQSTQEWLWEDFTWPHLRIERLYQLQAGQRFYDVKNDMLIDRIELIEVKVDGRWRRLDAGIDADHYAAHDSALDQRASPARRWRIYEGEQIEIWPVPDANGVLASQEGYIKVGGIRPLRPLVAGSDRCDIDDQLIYLYAAAKHLGMTEAGKVALNMANKRLARLKGELTPRREFKVFGLGDIAQPRRMFVGQYRPPSNA